jgi:hypothetical protein
VLSFVVLVLVWSKAGVWHQVLCWLVGVCWQAPAVTGAAPDPLLLLLLLPLL